MREYVDNSIEIPKVQKKSFFKRFGFQSSSFKEHTWKSKVMWVVLLVLIWISVASFFTQSIMYTWHSLFGNKQVIQNEPIGSDDGTNLNGSSTSVKIPNQQYKLDDINHFPVLSSKSFLIADIKSGEVIRESQDTNSYPIASVSKLKS